MLHKDEVISVIIARIKRNKDKQFVRKELYRLLETIRLNYDLVSKHIPIIKDVQTTSFDNLLKYMVGKESADKLWDSRDEVMEAIKEINKLLKEENG